jgi:AraC-like DNA-binding protein
MESCISYEKEHIQRIVPSGMTELIFYFENKPETSAKNKTISDSALLSGQLYEYYDLIIKSNISLFSILFHPDSISMFFEIPANVIFNQNVPLREFVKDEADKLETSLFEAKTVEARIHIIEDFLFNRLRKSKKKYEFNRIRNSIELINQTRGIISIDALASAACLSRKQYERTFSDFIGTSPKQFLRIVRFQNAVNEKSKNRNTNLTTLTYQCGYYDQSHMTNDFTKLTGMTPKQYFGDCEPYSDYFQ